MTQILILLLIAWHDQANILEMQGSRNAGLWARVENVREMVLLDLSGFLTLFQAMIV